MAPVPGRTLEWLAGVDTGSAACNEQIRLFTARTRWRDVRESNVRSANCADYILFGGFQWARATSAFKLLKEDGAIFAWRERMLDAFDRLARKSPGYEV